MKRFIEGEDRKQVTLLPECLDDFVAEDNPVRIIEAFVEELDLASLERVRNFQLDLVSWCDDSTQAIPD
ncbi:transposase [Paraburkholderia youngii]|uniref:hypothetical protein n=1 Tax=Paraburkholderia youngii TaxID=2782701 RepID=UPI003D1B8070